MKRIMATSVMFSVIGNFGIGFSANAGVIPEEHLWLVEKYCPEWKIVCREHLDECYRAHGAHGFYTGQCMRERGYRGDR